MSDNDKELVLDDGASTDFQTIRIPKPEEMPVNDGQSDILGRMGVDPENWAKEFVKKDPKYLRDPEYVVGWFRNAIEAGRTGGSAIPEPLMALVTHVGLPEVAPEQGVRFVTEQIATLHDQLKQRAEVAEGRASRAEGQLEAARQALAEIRDNPMEFAQDYLDDLMRRIHQVNVDNGWFEAERSFGEGIALLHSEVSEALEEYREHGMDRLVKWVSPSGGFEFVIQDSPRDLARRAAAERQRAEGVTPDTGKPIGVASEYADILIRLLDDIIRNRLSEDDPTSPNGYITLFEEVERKLAFNVTRGRHHGGKRL